MSAVPQRIGRDRAALLLALGAMTGIGWLVLLRLRAGMPGPSAVMAVMRSEPDIGLGPVLAMWIAMLAAMMAPATGPVLSAYLALFRRRHPERGALFAASGFFAGYMVTWISYAILGAAAQWLLARALLLSPMESSASAWLSAGILAIAGLYQLTPLKRACITRCRSPLLQLMGNWRDGVRGALRLGLGQGSWCVGCCWALMALMFVVGTMNLLWMAVVALVILGEKLVPARWHLDQTVGLLLLAACAWMIAGAG